MLVFDLEDSVRPEDREGARELVAGFIDHEDIPERTTVCVRINAPGSEWWEADLEAFDGRVPLMIPKISAPEDIPAGAGSEIVPILETLSGVDLMPVLADMAGSADGPVIRTVIFGKEDLSAELGHINTDPDSTNPIPSTDLRRSVVMRGLFSYIRWGTPHNLRVIDGVTKRFGWDKATMRDLKAECAFAWGMGAAGKLSVHMAQVAAINEIFHVTDGPAIEPQSGIKPELEQDITTVPRLQAKLINAGRIVREFERNEKAQNIATLQIDGQMTMVGPPAYRLAKAILERAA
jgi:citrate lyase subunit beta/citryl-CoA lyase